MNDLDNELKQQIIKDFKEIINFSRSVSNKLKNYNTSQLENYLKNHLEFESVKKLIRCICLDIKLPNCKYCGKPIKYSKRKRIYCDKFCAHRDPDIKNKIKNTFDKNFRQNPKRMNDLGKRIKETQIKKYGGCGFQSLELRKRAELSTLKKYGVKNVFESKEIQQKIKETNIKKYGVEYPMQNNEILQRYKNSMLEKYNVEYPANDENIRNKQKKTMLEKYGVEYSSQRPEYIDLVRKTSIERFGVNNFNHLKTWKTIQSFKDYVIPLFKKEDLTNYAHDYKWKCVKCGLEFISKINFQIKLNDKMFWHFPRCPNCFPYSNTGTSQEEKELVEFCKQYFPILKENDRKLIKPYEVDILINELKLAIEFNGIFYHSKQGWLCKRNLLDGYYNYHLNKVLKCNEKGYRLIHIWEDDWNNNKDEIKRKLIEIFEGKEIIDYSKPLDRSWYNNLEGDFEELPPEIIIRNGYEVENCGYLIYNKNIDNIKENE